MYLKHAIRSGSTSLIGKSSLAPHPTATCNPYSNTSVTSRQSSVEQPRPSVSRDAGSLLCSNGAFAPIHISSAAFCKPSSHKRSATSCHKLVAASLHSLAHAPPNLQDTIAQVPEEMLKRTNLKDVDSWVDYLREKHPVPNRPTRYISPRKVEVISTDLTEEEYFHKYKTKGLSWNSSHHEDLILNHLRNKINGQSLRNWEGTICIFNPGLSSFPARLMNDGLRNLVILEGDSAFSKHWKSFEDKYKGGMDHLGVHDMNFLNLHSLCLRSHLHDPPDQHLLHSLFPHQSKKNSSTPNLLFIGCLSRQREEKVLWFLFFQRLYHTGLFQWSDVQFLFFLSATENARLSGAVKLWRTNCRLRDYNLLHETTHLATARPEIFYPKLRFPSKPKFQRHIKQSGLSEREYHLVEVVGRERVVVEGVEVAEEHSPLFFFFRRQLFALPLHTSLLQALRHWFPNFVEQLEPTFYAELQAKNLKEVSDADTVRIFHKLVLPYSLAAEKLGGDRADGFMNEFSRSVEDGVGAMTLGETLPNEYDGPIHISKDAKMKWWFPEMATMPNIYPHYPTSLMSSSEL